MSRLFCWKTFYKDSFSYFSVFGNIKKCGQRKTIFGQQKTLVKIRLIFYRLFSKKKKKVKQFIFHAAHNSYKNYLLLTQEIIFSFAHSAFLTINSITSSLPFVFFLSSYTLTVTTPPQLCKYHSLWGLCLSRFSSPSKHAVVGEKASTH